MKKNIHHNKKQINQNNSLNHLFQLGIKSYIDGRIDEAEKYFTQYTNLNPYSAEVYFNIGAIKQDKGLYDTAADNYKKAIALDPRHLAARNNLANIYLENGKGDEAIKIYDEIIEKDHSNQNAHLNKGNALFKYNKFKDARESFLKCTKLNPRNTHAYHRLGLCEIKLGNQDDAMVAFEKSIKLNSNNIASICCLGEINLEKKYPDKALELYSLASDIAPNNLIAIMGKGDSLLALKKYDEAIKCYRKAASIRSDLAEAFNNIGAAHIHQCNIDDALENLNKAISIKKDFAEAHDNIGFALLQKNDAVNALEHINHALSINPELESALLHKSAALTHLGRHEECLEILHRFAEKYPENSKIHGIKGISLLSQGRTADAIPYLERALALNPESIEVKCNLGIAFMNLWRLEEAENLYKSALEAKPENKTQELQILNNLGGILFRLRKLDESSATFKKIHEIDREYKFNTGTLLHNYMHTCNWDDYERLKIKIYEDVDNGKKVIYPFLALALSDSPDLHRKVAKIYRESSIYHKGDLSHLEPAEEKSGKIRVGYFSADFHNHATAYLMAELIELHDRDRFEVYGFSYGPRREDDMRNRLFQAFDEFVEVGHLGDRQIASLSRVLGIDIAVDLKGYTEGARMGIFIERCAPIQVSYLGYPGTTEIDEMDYIIGDSIVMPNGCDDDYSEEIIRLPNCYQVNDSQRKIADIAYSRQELGLPEKGFVFCCFNNNYKILPETFDSWMRILHQVSNSVLWLLSDNTWAEENLVKEASKRGIDPDRIIFCKRKPLEQHLARIRHADLFLDTFPYNAHTTASDALWAGVPVLTRTGRSFASRVAASLLTAINVPELITQSINDYELMAVDLANDIDKLQRLREKIENNKLNSHLFNSIQFASDLEQSLLQIAQNS